jgi:hypothetical protein
MVEMLPSPAPHVRSSQAAQCGLRRTQSGVDGTNVGGGVQHGIARQNLKHERMRLEAIHATGVAHKASKVQREKPY